MLVGIQPAAPNSMAGLAEWLRRWIVAPVTRVRFSHLAPKWAVRIRGLPTACNREMRVRVSHRPPKFGSGTRRQSAGLKSQWIRFNSVPSHQIARNLLHVDGRDED